MTTRTQCTQCGRRTPGPALCFACHTKDTGTPYPPEYYSQSAAAALTEADQWAGNLRDAIRNHVAATGLDRASALRGAFDDAEKLLASPDSAFRLIGCAAIYGLATLAHATAQRLIADAELGAP